MGELKKGSKADGVFSFGSIPMLFMITLFVVCSTLSFEAGRAANAYLAAITVQEATNAQGPTPADEHTHVSEDDGDHGQHFIVNVELKEELFEKDLVELMEDLAESLDYDLLDHDCEIVDGIQQCFGFSEADQVVISLHCSKSVLFLDLLTRESNHASVLVVVDVLEKELGTPRAVNNHIQWTLRLRAFTGMMKQNPEILDMYAELLGSSRLPYKKLLAWESTPFQSIQIIELVDPVRRTHEGYLKSLEEGTYESQEADLFRPDRIVHADGVMQSTRYREAIYHEALVHPALFTHDNPKRVAIIGGGEGATLREVLKHDTVEEVYMIEIDEMMVKLSREFLPEWNDCSNLEGSADNCFDDPRTKLYCEDAVAWFLDRYLDDEGDWPEFDVIIMDSLDPGESTPFANIMYGKIDYARAIYNALSDTGIFVSQIGSTSWMDDPSEFMGFDNNIRVFRENLEKVGFDYMMEYTESHCGFYEAWDFIIAFDDDLAALPEWFSNEAEVAQKIRKRGRRTKNGDSPFKFFDGTTMVHYHYADRAHEVVSCRTWPNALSCQGHGFDPEVEHIPVADLTVSKSKVSSAGRGVYSTRDIPSGSYLHVDDCVHGLQVPQPTIGIMEAMSKTFHDPAWDGLLSYVFGYGFVNEFFGADAHGVDPGISTFGNHGCNGTSNVGFCELFMTEWNATNEDPPSEKYNPSYVRNYMSHGCASNIALRDIAKGEELLYNYMCYAGPEERLEFAGGLRELCSGKKVGSVSAYEAKVQGAEELNFASAAADVRV